MLLKIGPAYISDGGFLHFYHCLSLVKQCLDTYCDAGGWSLVSWKLTRLEPRGSEDDNSFDFSSSSLPPFFFFGVALLDMALNRTEHKKTVISYIE